MGRLSDIEEIEMQRSVIELIHLGRTKEYLSKTLDVSMRQIREWLEQSAGQDGTSADRMRLLGQGELVALRREISALRRKRDLLRVMHAMKGGSRTEDFSRRPVTISIRAMPLPFTGYEIRD